MARDKMAVAVCTCRDLVLFAVLHMWTFSHNKDGQINAMIRPRACNQLPYTVMALGTTVKGMTGI